MANYDKQADLSRGHSPDFRPTDESRSDRRAELAANMVRQIFGRFGPHPDLDTFVDRSPAALPELRASGPLGVVK